MPYQGETLDLVFVNPYGGPMLRQHVDKAVRKAVGAAGLDPSDISTHTGRRSVVTNLYASGDLDLEDVARFVGHSDVSTTRGYVESEGNDRKWCRARRSGSSIPESTQPNADRVSTRCSADCARQDRRDYAAAGRRG